MNRFIVASLSTLTLFFCSCKKNSAVPNTVNNNTNEFQLSFGGKNYDASNNFTVNSAGNLTNITPANYFIQASIQNFTPPSSLLCAITCDIAGKFQCNFDALLAAGNTTRTGTYTVLNSYYFLDSTAGYTVYTMDSTSSITLTEADSAWIAGTMNFDMVNNNGTHFPATGSFRISARN